MNSVLIFTVFAFALANAADIQRNGLTEKVKQALRVLEERNYQEDSDFGKRQLFPAQKEQIIEKTDYSEDYMPGLQKRIPAPGRGYLTEETAPLPWFQDDDANQNHDPDTEDFYVRSLKDQNEEYEGNFRCAGCSVTCKQAEGEDDTCSCDSCCYCRCILRRWWDRRRRGTRAFCR